VVFRQNLLVSPMLWNGGVPVAVRAGQSSAGMAYNSMLDESRADVVIFAHQDVYFPAGWEQRLEAALTLLDATDPKWAVLGVIGVTAAGEIVGRCWSNGLNCAVGHAVKKPTAVESLDEVVILVRKDSGVRFDEQMPGFHLYGTDICQSALAVGRGVHVFDGPIVHNSVPVWWLGPGYAAAYRYMRRKWAARMPIRTTVIAMTPWGLPLWRNRLGATKDLLLGQRPHARRCDDPRMLAEKLDYGKQTGGAA
jgi:hypothetical protein